MTISFEIPQDIGREVLGDGADLNVRAREAFLVDLYREGQIAHHQLAEALGLTRIETDGALKRHGVSPGPTLEELRAEIGSLRDARPE